jgi:hypothetical protein
MKCALQTILTLSALITQTAAAEMALVFNRANEVVTVPHSPELNAYPFTLTAWVKTDLNDGLSRQIIGKRTSSNGYAIALQNGRVQAFYGQRESLEHSPPTGGPAG